MHRDLATRTLRQERAHRLSAELHHRGTDQATTAVLPDLGTTVARPDLATAVAQTTIVDLATAVAQATIVDQATAVVQATIVDQATAAAQRVDTAEAQPAQVPAQLDAVKALTIK